MSSIQAEVLNGRQLLALQERHDHWHVGHANKQIPCQRTGLHEPVGVRQTRFGLERNDVPHRIAGRRVVDRLTQVFARQQRLGRVLQFRWNQQRSRLDVEAAASMWCFAHRCLSKSSSGGSIPPGTIIPSPTSNFNKENTDVYFDTTSISVIAEIKGCWELNLHTQFRRAVSQLFE